MKPAPFDYVKPATVEQCLQLLSEHGSRALVLAGGQSLVRQLNLRQVRPELVIDLNGLAELSTIEVGDTLRVGALVRLAALEGNQRVRELLPILTEATALVAHPQIRTRSTIGGSLSHADPAAELPTVATALEATLHLRSRGADRTLPAGEFFLGRHRTARREDELLTAVEFRLDTGFRYRYEEISRRPNDLPIVGVCLGLAITGDTIDRARVAAAGLGDRPIRLPAVENRLAGRPLTADVSIAGLVPEAEDRFRLGLLATAIRRALHHLAAGPRLDRAAS